MYNKEFIELCKVGDDVCISGYGGSKVFGKVISVGESESGTKLVTIEQVRYENEYEPELTGDSRGVMTISEQYDYPCERIDEGNTATCPDCGRPVWLSCSYCEEEV